MSATTRLQHFGWGRVGEGLMAEEEAFVRAGATKALDPQGLLNPGVLIDP